MALQPVNRRSVPEDVFEQILADVLSGEMRPGEPLPSERRLAEVLGVSRPAGDGAWRNYARTPSPGEWSDQASCGGGSGEWP